MVSWVAGKILFLNVSLKIIAFELNDLIKLIIVIHMCLIPLKGSTKLNWQEKAGSYTEMGFFHLLLCLGNGAAVSCLHTYTRAPHSFPVCAHGLN